MTSSLPPTAPVRAAAAACVCPLALHAASGARRIGIIITGIVTAGHQCKRKEGGGDKRGQIVAKCLKHAVMLTDR